MNRLLSVTSLTGLLTLLKMCLGFIVGKIIAIYIGPSGVALLGQLQGIVSIFNGLANAPASSGIVRYTSQNFEQGYEKCAPWWRASVVWILILSSIAILIAFVSAQYLSETLLNNADYKWLIILIALFLPLTAIGTMINSIVNGQQQYKRYVSMGAISVIISNFLMVALIVKFGITGALVSISLQSSFIGCVMFFLVLKQPWFLLRNFFGEFSIIEFKAISGYILMMIASATLMPLALVAVRKILVINTGWNAAGEWQAVWKISETYLSIVTMALGTYFLPKLSKLQSQSEYESEIKNAAKIILPIVGLMALIIFLIRDAIISLLFTIDFYGARDYFSVQLIGDFVKIAAWLFAYPMLSKGKVKLFVSLEIVFAISLVFLCWLLVPVMGVHGANFAYAMNYLLYFIVVKFNFKKIVN
ncbi:O-antigen translocase [Buttiauxella sp. A2-C1_F]|uniref:O-antigen translocase n=1 Tax=Buttiauxella sp. A2-C1_F TaxID=2904526 RepID=UPI001E4828BA|nr:O-antigen translocase [Buttiauxella sp. A2-C1_F]MCE0846439.1 O-antigen translocase [Buttiauxella sp. A2-C1_F]